LGFPVEPDVKIIYARSDEQIFLINGFLELFFKISFLEKKPYFLLMILSIIKSLVFLLLKTFEIFE